MRILAIEPFYGGSHRAFLDGWIEHSRHEWTLISYSAHHWKWRMRHAAMTAADEINARAVRGASWDALFCSDMLNLAELRGLSQVAGGLPSVLYFHENQLTYPVREERERDTHFAVSNFVSALAADQVWFNSAFHRRDFLEALERFWPRLPDHRPLAQTHDLAAKSVIESPGVDDAIFEDSPRQSGPADPPSLTWAARWEFDKNPQAFFAALHSKPISDAAWRLNVLGQRFATVPECFHKAEQAFANRINAWGAAERERYRQLLAETDVFVATANHEFFGIAAVEAMAAGAAPLLPNRLAYPELLDAANNGNFAPLYYADDAALPLALERLLKLHRTRELGMLREQVRAKVSRFRWSTRAAAMDDRLDSLRGLE